MRAAIPVCVASLTACSAGISVTVVTVDARPSVHNTARLEVVLRNGDSSLTQDFDLHGHSFPASFSVTTPGRDGSLDVSIRAFTADNVLVGVGAASAAIQAKDETDVSLLLDPTDFAVNTQVAGEQRTVFYVSTGGRQLAAAPDGNFTIAWTDDCMTIGRCDEWGRRFDKTGAPRDSVIAAGSAQFNLNRTAIFGTDAALAAGTSGDLVAVWTTAGDTSGAPELIACSAIGPDGSATTGAEVTLSTAGAVATDHPAIAALSGDHFGVVWEETAMGTTTPVIRFVVVDKSCAPLMQPVTVSTATSPAPDHPAIAGSVDGTSAAIAWRAGSIIRGRLIDKALAPAGTEFDLLQLGADALWGIELAPADGGFALAYGTRSAAGALAKGGFVLRRLGDTGVLVGAPSVITTNLPDSTSVAGLARRADGALALTWSACGADGDGMGCGVFAQLARPTGLPVGAKITVDTTIAGDQTDPSIAALPDAFALTWTDGSMAAPDQSATGIRARLIFPTYDDAKGVIGAACGGDRPCGDGLVCATGSDNAARCHPHCNQQDAPACPAGGTCTAVDETAACIF